MRGWEEAQADRDAEQLRYRQALDLARSGASTRPDWWAEYARARLQEASETCRMVIARGKTPQRRAWHLAEPAAGQVAESRAARGLLEPAHPDITG